ncbi:MAG TPA: T9SS type A sorting domain-containing protein, partial [Chitinophagales bacterium]|nr:T9SS type A sorting domain-containing protein [Chitinophagales bacterium]
VSEAQKPETTIYPNPATDQFTLEVITDAYYADMFIDILNLQGVRLKSLVTNSTNLTIDVQDLPAGTYMVVVHTEAEAPVVKRIVIQ